MINGSRITKAQLARELCVSRAYITMVSNGKRKPSQEFVNRVQRIYCGESVNKSECNFLTFNQGVAGSRPARPTKT